MSVKIKNTNVCVSCNNQDCCFRDAQIKTNFHELRSETTVCPTAVLSENPINIANHQGLIADKKCIDCGLCVLSCHQNNLECADLEYEKDSFTELTELQTNAIACSYLAFLFGFAANTNRNKSMQFDGYVSNRKGREAFVEIDKENDSLESVRRLIGDILLYSPKDRPINIGIVVLSRIPQKGTRDVYTVLEKLKEFPTTKHFNIYFTTIRLLRLLAMNLKKNDSDFSDILIDLLNKESMDYINDMNAKLPKELFRPMKYILDIL